MVLVCENVHPRGLDFRNQRKIVLLRDVHGLTFPEIAKRVKNLAGKRPSVPTCWLYHKSFSMTAGRRKSKYQNCGRKPWKLTADVQRYLLNSLKQRRLQEQCTCFTLQAALARAKGVTVEESTIRKFIMAKGYRWLPRVQKRLYTAAQKRQRLDFAERVIRLGRAGPPKDATDRLNFLHQTHIWRLKSEHLDARLGGQDPFAKQTRLDRAIPLWGGLSPGGFATACIHSKKKLTTAEWVAAMQAGKLVSAIKRLGPTKPDGPWHVLCDNEKFLLAPESRAQYRKDKVRLWQIPPKSPDLNPIERFWSYLRRRLRRLDLADASKRVGQNGLQGACARGRAIYLCPTSG